MGTTVEPPHGGALCKTHLVYEMTCKEYIALLGRAAGHCEVCGIAEEDTPMRILFIDHDKRYGNGAVRGLVCGRCNTHLGMYDNEDRYPGFHLDPRARGLSKFLANAWFMQLARSTRVLGVGLAAAEPDDLGLVQAALRNPVTQAVTKRLSLDPAVRIRVLATHRAPTFEARATYTRQGRDKLALHFEAVGVRKVEYRAATVERTRTSAGKSATRYDSWQDALAAFS